MRKRTLFYCLLPAVAGLALVVVAVLLSSFSPGRPVVASVQATDGGTVCDLQVDKEGSRTESEGNTFVLPGTGTDPLTGDNVIEYTITVTNIGQQDCEAFEVVDQLPESLICDGADVVSSPPDFEFALPDCIAGRGGQEVGVEAIGTLSPGDEVVLSLVATDNTDENCVTNRACAEGALTSAGLQDNVLVNGTCDEDTVCRRPHHTPTPTVTATATPKPTSTPFVPPPSPPTAKPLGTIVAPPTGSGANGSSSPWLALGLGVGGVCLLVVSGAALARKRIR